MLVGNDLVAADPKGKEAIEFRPQMTLWISSNHRPKVSDASDAAYWSRIRVIDFGNSIPKKEQVNTFREDVIREEAEGVLAALVAGAVDYFARKQHLDEPDAVNLATNAYKQEENSAAQFAKDYVVDGGKISKDILYKQYTDYCDQEGLEAMKKNAFGAALKKLKPGVQDAKEWNGSRQDRIWKGISLAQETEDAAA